jgi:hypothetical protein
MELQIAANKRRMRALLHSCLRALVPVIGGRVLKRPDLDSMLAGVASRVAKRTSCAVQNRSLILSLVSPPIYKGQPAYEEPRSPSDHLIGGDTKNARSLLPSYC